MLSLSLRAASVMIAAVRSGCGAARLAHLHGVQGAVGSNPTTPTFGDDSDPKSYPKRNGPSH